MELSTGKSSLVHEDVTDVDLSSLYPSTTEAYNISPETHMGRITHHNEETGEDDTVHFIDAYTSNDAINFGVEFMHLPSVSDFVNILEGDGDTDE